jgi:hypothetical protein
MPVIRIMRKYFNLMRKRILEYQFPGWTIPLALSAPLIAAFGLLIPQLGFYWDDWETVMMLRMFDISRFWSYFSGSRPLAAWTYVLFGPLLGTNTIAWHSFTLLLRWMAVLAMWWTLDAFWPRHRFQVTLAAFLFAVYPLFRQQSIAVAYHQHWAGYTFYLFSLGAMVQSIRKQGQYWLWTALSLIAFFLHVTIFEYFVGLEFLRPVMLWLLLKPERKGLSIYRQLLEVFKRWYSYLLALSIFITWRVWLSLASPDLADNPTLLFDLLNKPFGTLKQLIQMVFQDMVYILIANWYDVLEPQLVDLYRGGSMLIWLIVILISAGVFVFLSRMPGDDQKTDQEQLVWSREAMLLGLLATLLGALPIWITGRQVIHGLYNDRFAMAAMFGASLLITSLVDFLVRRNVYKSLLLAVLVGLSVGMHLRVGKTYAWSWTLQKRVHWQLFWRAPYIEPQTAILSEGEIFPYVRPTYSMNLLYLEPSSVDQLSYAFLILGRDISMDITQDENGRLLEVPYRGFDNPFTSDTRESLVIHYNPPDTDCLWVMKPEDQRSPYFLPETVRAALHLSDLNRIKDYPISEDYPPTDIFGPELPHDWCYFYEKADLNRQMGNWEAVVSLGEEAKAQGYSPSNIDSPHEWLPFIEGYAYSGDWDTVRDLSLAGLARDVRYRPSICMLVDGLFPITPDSSDKNEIYLDLMDVMQCF